jgi:beta-fructofuranosidase
MADRREADERSPDHGAFPVHRVRPPSGWVNDPNGPIRWRGRYHVFFQHNPHAPVHDRICWGHASSTDLVQWHHEPAALVPTPGGPDAGGCWSGCVVDDDGVATAVYTGAAAGPDTATVCLAYSTDDRLHRWQKRAAPVAGPPPDRALLGFRDPFLFAHHGHRYAVVGAGEQPDGNATLLLYRCDDLTTWSYQGALLDTTNALAAELAVADIWECPQLIELGDRWVLIVSLVAGQQLDRVAYLVGNLAEAGTGLRFVPESGGLVDHGHDLYAPAVLKLGDRALLWGWTWEDRPEQAVQEAGWAGALTITRELALTDDGQLHSTPVAEVSILHRDHGVVHLTGPSSQTKLPPCPVDLDVEATSDRDGIMILTLPGALELELDMIAGTADLRRDVHEPARRQRVASGSFAPTGHRRRVRIILDGSVAELFVEDGPSFTERVYATGPASLQMRGGNRSHCTTSVRRLVSTSSDSTDPT